MWVLSLWWDPKILMQQMQLPWGFLAKNVSHSHSDWGFDDQRKVKNYGITANKTVLILWSKELCSINDKKK